MSTVGEVFDDACLSEQNCLDLADLINGVSIAVRQSLYVHCLDYDKSYRQRLRICFV